MVKFLLIILFVLIAFTFMLGSIFLGNYKGVRSRFRMERKGRKKYDPETNPSACSGCSGECVH